MVAICYQHHKLKQQNLSVVLSTSFCHTHGLVMIFKYGVACELSPNHDPKSCCKLVDLLRCRLVCLLLCAGPP